GTTGLAADMPADRRKHRLIMRIGRIAVPAAERGCLAFTEAERWIDGIDQYRDIESPALRPRRLFTHELPVSADRALAPDDDHAPRAVELLLDRVPPRVAGADLLVPPDRQSVRLQRLNQRLHPSPVFRLVGDEDVGHFRRGRSA